MNAGDLAVEKGDMELAMKEYSTAEKMFPDNEEMKYWHAVTLANNGKVDDSLPIFKEVFSANENWRTLTERLPKVKLLTVTEEQLNKILSVR
jgi:tetratricopeptide (TPR) repeat protein